ncbi:putative ABC transporter permease [Enterococcus sp. AZ072]|uniref:putative ABC transporter permease n=1 Tax=unclassified Enterococcus TaxID=2608891 RepID=UPI003D270E14
MEREFSIVVLLFFCYSLIGWVWETIYCSIKAKKFVYRGFLLGPITPIYGFGVLGVLYFIAPYQNNELVVFCLAFILITALEYVTSFLLERLFHASLWDYNQVPLNINGRVAVPVSIFWGICCLLIVEVVNPRLMLLAANWSDRFGIFLPIGLLMLISFDLGFTLSSVPAFRRGLNELNEAIQEKKGQLQQTVEENKDLSSLRLSEIKQQVSDHYDWLAELRQPKEGSRRLPRLNLQERRFLSGFPNMQSKDFSSSIEEIRKLVKELRKDSK